VTASLGELMRQAGFTQAEMDKLLEAKRNSDTLVATETQAMNIVQGRYQGRHGADLLLAEPDLELARRILHDHAYHVEKARIMRPVDEFLAMLEARTERDRQGKPARGVAQCRDHPVGRHGAAGHGGEPDQPVP
jgi:methyl-accepting chemotaxis protein